MNNLKNQTNKYMFMKRIFISLSVLLTSVNVFAFTLEIKIIPLNDGEIIEARLCLPENKVEIIVS
ncbi:hypothetical protein FACS189411_08020 [Bacteroidia bacterium]|nr:hypothetical protein FACS189411_08020 [Bacteroidia bacterium]